MSYDLGRRAAPSNRRVAVLLCAVLVLLAALTQVGVSHPFAILDTLWFFIPIATFVLLPHVDEQNHPQQALEQPAFSPRPPPAR